MDVTNHINSWKHTLWHHDRFVFPYSILLMAKLKISLIVTPIFTMLLYEIHHCHSAWDFMYTKLSYFYPDADQRCPFILTNRVSYQVQGISNSCRKSDEVLFLRYNANKLEASHTHAKLNTYCTYTYTHKHNCKVLHNFPLNLKLNVPRALQCIP